jgi:hypothetical protein
MRSQRSMGDTLVYIDLCSTSMYSMLRAVVELALYALISTVDCSHCNETQQLQTTVEKNHGCIIDHCNAK